METQATGHRHRRHRLGPLKCLGGCSLLSSLPPLQDDTSLAAKHCTGSEKLIPSVSELQEAKNRAFCVLVQKLEILSRGKSKLVLCDMGCIPCRLIAPLLHLQHEIGLQHCRGKSEKSAKSGFGDDYDRIWEAKARMHL